MTVPEPTDPDARPPRRGPTTGMDPLPGSAPVPRPGGEVPEPPVPARPTPDGHLTLVATGREDRRHHVVDVAAGEFGDPTGLRARCGAPVEQVVPGLRADRADCPGCTLGGLR